MFLLYNDDETSACWSAFSYLIIEDEDDDDDDDATFILKIHGMILEICTEPLRKNKININFIHDKINLPIKPTKKISSIMFVSISAKDGNLSRSRPNRNSSYDVDNNRSFKQSRSSLYINTRYASIWS